MNTRCYGVSLGYLAKTNEDTMHFNQEMAAPDHKEFIQAVVHKVNAHIKCKHWELIPREQVPEGTKVLDSIWLMKCKYNILMQEAYKWKARLSVHGGQQEFGVNF